MTARIICIPLPGNRGPFFEPKSGVNESEDVKETDLRIAIVYRILFGITPFAF